MKVLVQETSLPTITGDLIRASLEQLHLEIGLPDRTDQWRWKSIDCLATECWLKDLLKYMSQHDFQLTDTLPTLRSYRASNKFLMKEFLANGYFKKDLQMLNECRKYLRVTTLAEITSADGRYLEEGAWLGIEIADPLNPYQWPRRTPLLPRFWKLWQQTLQATFLQPSISNQRKLRLLLGPWDNDVQQKWRWFYSAEENRVYHFEGAGWRVFSQQPSQVQRLQSLRFIRQENIVPTLPSEVSMASIVRTRTGVCITGINEVPPTSPPVLALHPATIQEALDQRDVQDTWPVLSVDSADNDRSFAASIIRGDARAVSDGSFKNKMGTSSSIFFHTKATDPRNQCECCPR